MSLTSRRRCPTRWRVHRIRIPTPTRDGVDRRSTLADLDAGSALFVGDNESDITAAKNAGIDSAFIRRPHRSDWDLDVWPTWEIGGLDDLHAICGS